MRHIRSLVYRLGFRPKPGSIFYSPSMDWIIAGRNFGRDFEHSAARIMQQMQERFDEEKEEED